MKRYLMMVLVIGCGGTPAGEETSCIQPGKYTCNFSLWNDDCPDGALLHSWEEAVVVTKQFCGSLSPDDTQEFCDADTCVSCGVKQSPPYLTTGYGGSLVCGIGWTTSTGGVQGCGYTAGFYCEN
jgi:hypothetical protein